MSKMPPDHLFVAYISVISWIFPQLLLPQSICVVTISTSASTKIIRLWSQSHQKLFRESIRIRITVQAVMRSMNENARILPTVYIIVVTAASICSESETKTGRNGWFSASQSVRPWIVLSVRTALDCCDNLETHRDEEHEADQSEYWTSDRAQ